MDGDFSYRSVQGRYKEMEQGADVPENTKATDVGTDIGLLYHGPFPRQNSPLVMDFVP